MTARARLVSTADGTSGGAFGPTEWGLLAVAAGVWGSSFVFIAEGLEAFAPGVITWTRLILGVATLSLFRRARRPIDREDWPTVVILGVIWMAVPFLLFPIAQQWISSSLAGMLNGAMPLFTAVFAASMLRRLPGPIQTIGLLVGFAGVILISLPSGDTSGTLSGVLLTLLATACYGYSVTVAVPLQQKYGSLPLLLRALTVALVVTTPLGLLSLPGSSWSWTSAAAIAALGAGGTALAYVAMATLVGRAGATRGSVAIYFIPIVAVVLGVWLRNERVAALGLAGMGLVLVGAYLTSRAERRRQPAGVIPTSPP